MEINTYYQIGFWIIALTLLLIEISIYYILKILSGFFKSKMSEVEPVKKTVKRIHTKINPVNFGNTIQGRKNPYKEYENEKGLYEPITPKKGIKIDGKEVK